MTFTDFCRLHGLVVEASALKLDRWVRVPTVDHPKKRNGAYKLVGDRGFVQNHATMGEVAVWHADADVKPRAPIDSERLRRRREAEREQRRRAISAARTFWNRAQPLAQCERLHPYLERKGLSARGCKALRFAGDLLVVPVWLGDALISVQTINPAGDKRFWPGAPVKAGACVLRRADGALTAIAEGLATGLAVYQSVRYANVIVAFDAGNLLPVVQRLRPTGSVVIAADNDWGTLARRGFNPGLDKARNAAELIGCGVAWPEGIEGTDFADMLHELGRSAAHHVERRILAGARYVYT